MGWKWKFILWLVLWCEECYFENASFKSNVDIFVEYFLIGVGLNHGSTAYGLGSFQVGGGSGAQSLGGNWIL